MSFSAVSPLKRSISFCLSSRKVCSRLLRERQYVTQFLYNSFSLLITAHRKNNVQRDYIILIHSNSSLPCIDNFSFCKNNHSRNTVFRQKQLKVLVLPERLQTTTLYSLINQNQRSLVSPCLTVGEGRSLPCLIFSLAVCSADDRNSSAFMYSTNCSA